MGGVARFVCGRDDLVTKTGSSRQYVDVSESDRPPGPGLDDFDAIYHRELDYVWRTLARFGVAPSDLGDAAHDVFIVVFRRWSELDPTRPVRPWLFGIARRVAAGRRRKPAELANDRPETAVAVDPRVAQRELLWSALATLDDMRREVIILHDLEGHTGAEIATLLGLSINTVHSRLRLARASLLAAVQRLRGAP
jgi:RNA polymerase sigma-70 factor (ECF subfamily)